jgi:hypothetical protein
MPYDLPVRAFDKSMRVSTALLQVINWKMVCDGSSSHTLRTPPNLIEILSQIERRIARQLSGVSAEHAMLFPVFQADLFASIGTRYAACPCCKNK